MKHRRNMDAFTKKHLRTWLQQSVFAGDRRKVGKLIRAYVRRHPEVLTELPSQSWPQIQRLAEASGINPRDAGVLQKQREARDRAAQIRSASGRNPRRVVFDSSIQKYMAHKYLSKYGNMVGTGETKAAAVRSLKEAIARAKGGSRNPQFTADLSKPVATITQTQKDPPYYVLKMGDREIGATSRARAERYARSQGYRVVDRQNPAELLVMGANPASESTVKHLIEIYQDLRSGGMNHSDAIAQTLTRYSVGDADRQEFKRRVSRAGGRLWPGINPTVEVVHGDNPPVEEITEDFTGSEVKWLDVYNEPHIPRGRYAYLAKLMRLLIKPAKGGQVQKITFPEDSRPIIVSDSSGKQMYFVDGGQDMTACLDAFIDDDASGVGIVKLGQAREIHYWGIKHHIGDEDTEEWRHKHGEEDGALPTVLFDTRNKRLLYEGGNYRIEGPWIHN
jgi:hypothetical protein